MAFFSLPGNVSRSKCCLGSLLAKGWLLRAGQFGSLAFLRVGTIDLFLDVNQITGQGRLVVLDL